jgi:hypothetical protein
MSTIILRPDGEQYFAGNDISIERDVEEITVSDPLVKAWMSFKFTPSADDPGVLQKVITPNLVVGVGQITQDGSEQDGNGTASLFFRVTKIDGLTILGTTLHYYDIQVKTQSGDIFTAEDGMIQLRDRVTDAVA